MRIEHLSTQRLNIHGMGSLILRKEAKLLEGILLKMQSAKGENVRLTIDIPKKNVTVDLMDFIDKPINVTIPDEEK